MKLAIITDVSAGIAEEYKTHPALSILDIPLVVNGQTYHASQISDEDYYSLMASSEEVPKTSQPSAADLKNLLTKLREEEYTHVLGFFLSHKISGFYQNIFYMQSLFEGMKIYFPETRITSAPLGYMVETALNGLDLGKSFEEIVATFEAQRGSNHAFMLVDDLKWLAKSGRLSNGVALLGTLLNIKPVLQFSQKGQIELLDQVRTSKKAVKKIQSLLLEHSDPKNYKVYVIHSDAKEKAETLSNYAKGQGYQDVEITTFGPVVVTHLGLGAVAYAMTKKG